MDDGIAAAGTDRAPAEDTPEATPPVETVIRAETVCSTQSDPPTTQTEQVIAKTVRYIKAKRGGDLAAIILAGSAAQDALTPHSDVDVVVLVRGTEGGHELVRVLDRIVEIRYMALTTAEEQVRTSPRLPVILRKACVLFEFETAGTAFLEQARARFRQGPSPLTLYEKIRMRTESLHWLGKAIDRQAQPALARYLFSIYLDECISAFYRLRGFWPGSPTEHLRFISQRDPALADLLQQALTAANWPAQMEAGHRIADHLFREVPAPARID